MRFVHPDLFSDGARRGADFPAFNVQDLHRRLHADENNIRLSVEGIELVFAAKTPFEYLNDKVVLGVRPEFISIEQGKGIASKVYSSLPAGMETTIKVKVNETIFTLVEFGIIDYDIDADVNIVFKGENIILFDKESTNQISVGSLEIK